nr:MAG TPA: Baseplate J like protein [Caudoviricetes sp.]
MITKVSNTIANLKNLWIEMFLNKTDKVSNIADGSVLNAVAFGTAKVAQKAIKDIAIVEAQIFPTSATGTYLDKSAALFGVSPRKQALGSSTYIRVYAEPGTLYEVGTTFVSKNGIRFIVDKPFTVDNSGYGYVSVRSVITGSATNVEANSITQVSPRPLTHIECTNEYAAIGGRDYEDDETFRNRIINYNNRLSEETVESWTQIFQDLDDRILKVMNVGLGEDGKTHIYLVTQNGSFFTDDELEELLDKATPYFGLTELNLSGESIGIVLENAKWMYVGGEQGVDFRVELSPNTDIADARKNIQIAMTKYLDFRFWEAGKVVQWDDLLQVVKTAEGVKYVPDEYFFPYFDEEVPLNMLPRIKGFRMRDLEGNILYDSGSNLSNIFYPAGESDIYKGTQSAILSQKYLVSFTVTTLKNVAVPGAFITIGNKVITTDESGTANVLLENGEYTYTLNKANWVQQTGEFVVLNGPIFITINNFEATPYKVTFTIYEGEAPMEGAEIKIGINTLETDDTGIASVDLEPGTYSYTVSKAGFKTIESVLTVENKPVEIFERMFLESLTVNFAVIDRRRSVYVPQADITVTNTTQKTDDEGQAQMGLQVGQYEIRVMKEGYQEYKNTIEVVGEKPNCVLVELDAIPYEVKFTVLDSENDMVIPNATVSINESTYLTDEHGVVIVSLPNGTFTYTVFRSGYMSYSDFIVVDDAPISKIIKLNKAFYTLKLIVRDIENGNYIQGAELNINEETKITNVNGVATVTLGNGTYDYVVTQRNYKKYTGQIIIKDQDVVETIYLELRDTVITYTATDALTKAPISGVYIELINKGTGIRVDSGYTNDIGVLQLGAEAGEYTWNATHRYYNAVENQAITLEKLKDVDLPFTMTRREIEPEVDVIENIPGVSGDATTVRFSGENTAETLSNDSYYYIVHTPGNFIVPNRGTTFDLMDHVKTFRRAEIGGDDEPYDFAEGGAELKFNVSNDEIASLEGTILTVQPNVTRDAETRTFYVDVTITTPVSQVTVKISAEQKAALNFNPVKAGIVVSVKNMFNDNIREYTTDATGKIYPEVMPGVDYQLTIKQTGFYENDGLLIKNWDFGASVPTLMEITCAKKLELRVKQQNTLRPLENANITVSGMSLPQTVTSGSDGAASVYISPLSMSYKCMVADHIDKTGTFTPPLSVDYLDIIMGYAEMTLTVNLTSLQPYESAAAGCPVTVTSAWGGTPSQAYSFSGTANASGVFTSKGNGQFNIPPGEYTITYGGGNSNFNSKTGNITLPEDMTISTTVVRRTISVGYTVKEIIPSISTTASNPVKAGMVLACYYNDNGESSGANVTTNANGDFVKTVYAGIAERFQIQPVTFYEGNGAVATVNYSDTRTKDLVYTCSKRIPVYITSNLYGELSGASVTFSGMSVNQTGTTDTDGIVQMYISPVNMSYSVSKQHYDTKTGSFKPTGTETRMDIELEVKEYPVTFHVSTQGVLPPDGIMVRITNNVLPDLVFEGETNAEGTIMMQDVPAGEYTYEILAGEVSSDTFSHPQSESGTVLDVEVQYELINAGIQVSEVYGAAGRAYLANQTITMTSKAGTIKLTLDENGYTNQLLIKNLEYTFTTDSYPNFYSNPTQSYTWTEDGVIWPFNLNVTAKITVNVKDVYAKNNIQGVTVTYNEQVGTTDASGNVSLFRSALEKDYSLDKDDYSTVNGTIAPTTASPLNVTMLRNKHVVTVQQYEVIPGGASVILDNNTNFTLAYTSAAGNGTVDAGKNTFEAYLGIPITFTISAPDRRPFYTNYQQTHTFTTSSEKWNMNLTCAKQITVNVKDDVPGVNVPGATVTYFSQTKTTDSSGNAVLYWSANTRNISVSASNLASYTGQIAYNSPNPFNIVMSRAANPVTLVVREITPAQITYYQNLQIKYTAGSATGTLTTNASGAVTFNGYIGTEMTFTVVGHPEFYSNPTQKHTYTAANQSWTMDLTVTAKITINVKSNVPSGTNLSGATVSYFHQTGTTDNSGNVSLYRSSVTRNVDVTATYHGNYRGSITSSTASPLNVVMTRSTATVSLGVQEVIPVTPKYMLEITTDASSAVTPGLGGFYLGTPTAANKEFVAYFRAKVPAGRQLVFASNATGDNSVRKWVDSNNGNGTGGWYTYAYYVRCGSTGSFSTTNFFYLNGGSRPVTWYLEMVTVYDITGSNVQNASDATILSKCTYDKIPNAYRDFLFDKGSNNVNVYNNSSGSNAVKITRKAASGTDTFNFGMGVYSSMKMNFSPAASTSPLTLDTNGNVSFVCYLGTPVTFTPTTRANYYSNPNTALTYTAAGQFQGIYLICNQKIVINTVANIYNTSNALSGTITYFGQTRASGGDFYRSGLDRQMTATAQYFNNYVGTVTATQTSPYTVTMNRTTRTVTLTVIEKVPNISEIHYLKNAVMVRSVPKGSNAPAGEITLDASGKKTNTVYAGINYTYTPKNYANYYSNASQEWTWVSENQSWTMTLNVTARLTFNIKSSNYGTNISGVTCSYFGQTGTTDSSGNWTVYRSGIGWAYSFSKTNYNKLTGTLSAAQASPLNLKMSETSSSITITIKDYYQSAVKGNANGCPVTLTNKSLSSITFTGTINSSGQVSFGPMIAGSYTLSWGGGTSYWVAGSATITMPTASTTQNAVRLTKSVGTEFRLRVPFSTPVLGYWGTANLVKPVFTTAGVATTVSLTANNVVYYLATYTWIAGITTTITAKLANYFVTGTTTTETPYSITPNYNFSNIGHNSDATAFYSTAIKSIVVTVQNSYTNAAVSGATINMYGINGSYQTSGELGAGYATQTVTTNSSGQATVYVSGLTNRYVVSATRYVTLNTTNTNTSNFTIKLVPSEVTITITVNDANTGTNVGSGCIVKLSSNNSSTTYSGTTNSSGQVVLKIKPGNYWWEAGGTATWGASGTGTWNYPNRSTTSISLVKDQSITIEALKVGVWVTNFATYTNMNGSETDYTGFDARYQTSGAFPSNNRSIFTDIDFNENNKFLFSFGRTQDVADRINLLKNKVFRPNNKTMTGDWDSLFNDYSYQYLQEVQVVSSGITYFKKESDKIYFGLYAVIIKNLKEYYSVQFNVLRVSEFSSSLMNLGWSDYPIGQIWVDESFNMYSINNTFCPISAFEADGSNYNYGYYIASCTEDSNSIYISIMKQFSYMNISNIEIINLHLDDVTQSYQYNFLTKRIYYKYNSSADEVQIIILGFARTSDQWRCFIIVYNGDIQLLGAINHRYRSFENIPSSVNDNMGTNGWVSPDLKWFFHTPLIKNEYNYFDKKGLGTVRGVNALFDMNGWSSTTYYQDDDSTLDLRNALANYYVLEIQFNKNNNKILVLCNDTQGAFRKVVNNDYVNGCSPTHIFAFVYNGKKWVQLSQSIVGLTDIWNTYQNSMSGKTNSGFRPPFIISPNYEGVLKISYIYPAMERIYTAYQATLTFGD